MMHQKNLSLFCQVKFICFVFVLLPLTCRALVCTGWRRTRSWFTKMPRSALNHKQVGLDFMVFHDARMYACLPYITWCSNCMLKFHVLRKGNLFCSRLTGKCWKLRHQFRVPPIRVLVDTMLLANIEIGRQEGRCH